MSTVDKCDSSAEVSLLAKERDWLLQTYAASVFSHIDSLLKDCSRRLPTRAGAGGASLQTDKFTLAARNDASGKGDTLRCVLTLMADNIVQAELAVRYARAPGGVFRSVAQPDVQCKLEQAMDLANYLHRCVDALAAAKRLLSAASGGPNEAQSLMVLLLQIMENIELARGTLLAPRRRSLAELRDCQLNRSFNPALPPDLLVSLYASAGKLTVAVYQLQSHTMQQGSAQAPAGAHASSNQSYQVYQFDAPVQWLGDALGLLTVALHCAQQLKDKLALFLDVPDLRMPCHTAAKCHDSEEQVRHSVTSDKGIRF